MTRYMFSRLTIGQWRVGALLVAGFVALASTADAQLPGGQGRPSQPGRPTQPARMQIDPRCLTDYFQVTNTAIGRMHGEPAMRIDVVAKGDFADPGLCAWIYLRGPRGQQAIEGEIVVPDREHWRRGERGSLIVRLPNLQPGSAYPGWTVTGIAFHYDPPEPGVNTPIRFRFDD